MNINKITQPLQPAIKKISKFANSTATFSRISSHCFTNESCECDALCDWYSYQAGTGNDLDCGLFLPNCVAICQCTGVGCLKNPSMSCSSDLCSNCSTFTCSMFCRCEV
mgnify:CR=1 FL=1